MLALSVLVILISPCAASPLTTLRTPHKVMPPTAVLYFATHSVLANWSASPLHGVGEPAASLVLPGSEVVALTCAWLC